MSRRAFLWLGLAVALLLAGVVSYWASAAPDGLNKVADDHGISDQEKSSATGDSPFAGYGTAGIGDERLSGGIAGVVGVAVTFGLAGGVFVLVRRRGHREPDEETRQLEPDRVD